MKKFYTLSLTIITAVCLGQVPITALNVSYSENFDSMGASGTALPANWSAVRLSGTGIVNASLLPLVVTDGSSNSGAVYNVGTNSATDRSVGSLASNSTVPTFGVNFVNNTGNQITAFTVSAIVEQWRLGGDIVVESMPFSYSTDATSLFTGTWTNVPSLDAVEMQTGLAPAAPGVANIDGNLVVNQTAIQGNVNISSSPLLNNGTVWVRWADVNAIGSDCLLAIDNFTFRATSSTLSITKNEISGLSIYPNPSKDGKLFIISDANENKSVVIFDLLGKQVLKTNASSEAINIASLRSGAYFVKVTENGKTATRKLLVQ